MQYMLKSVYQQSGLRSNFFVVWNELVKNIKSLLAYPTIIVFWAIFPFSGLFHSFFRGKL